MMIGRSVLFEICLPVEATEHKEVSMVIQYEGTIGFQMQEMLTSLSQDSVSAFVVTFLQRHQIPFKQNANGIFNHEHPDAPMITCFLDDVANLEDMNLLYQLEWENNPLEYANGTIAEEGKFGVFLLLKMLQKYPDLNFIFSRNEMDPRDLQDRFIREAVTLA